MLWINLVIVCVCVCRHLTHQPGSVWWCGDGSDSVLWEAGVGGQVTPQCLSSRGFCLWITTFFSHHRSQRNLLTHSYVTDANSNKQKLLNVLTDCVCHLKGQTQDVTRGRLTSNICRTWNVSSGSSGNQLLQLLYLECILSMLSSCPPTMHLSRGFTDLVWWDL